MTDRGLLKRITSDRSIFDGKPSIRGMRISVALILSLLAQGGTLNELLEDYPGLEPQDDQACLVYARQVIAGE